MAEREAVDANYYVVMSVAVGTVFALSLLVTGVVLKSEWFLMLAVYYAVLSFGRSYFLVPARRGRTSRSYLIRGYQKVRMAGILFILFQLILLLFIILKRKEGYFYPVPVRVLLSVFILFRLFLLYQDYIISFGGTGPYAMALKCEDALGFLMGILFIVHILFAVSKGSNIPGESLWVVGAAIFGVQILCSGYLLLFSYGKIRSYEMRRSEPAQGEARKGEPGRNEPAQSEARKREPGRNTAHKSGIRKSGVRKVEPRKSEIQRSEPHKSEIRKSELLQKEIPKSEPHTSEIPNSEPPISEVQKVEVHKSEPQKAEP